MGMSTQWAARAHSPGASDTAEPATPVNPPSQKPTLSCPVSRRAGVCAGCWALDAGGCWTLGLLTDCLGQGIRVGSWLADLSCCCT